MTATTSLAALLQSRRVDGPPLISPATLARLRSNAVDAFVLPRNDSSRYSVCSPEEMFALLAAYAALEDIRDSMAERVEHGGVFVEAYTTAAKIVGPSSPPVDPRDLGDEP